ncbi:MAG: class I SAM-dependent methyltransferase, partial [Asgard group archaeon]|nr:class I SAM-dependent methyltransferase [Asgard group archaeon]
MELTTAEKQFLMLLKGVERQPKDFETGEKVDANIETLKKRGKFYFSERLDSMTFSEETLVNLLDNELVEQQETIFKLTNEGKGLAKKARKNLLNKNNNEVYRVLNSSKALANITKQVYGKNLGQNNMMTMPELNMLLEVLKITPEDSVIDLGCGTGKITEYISDVTQAQVIG